MTFLFISALHLCDCLPASSLIMYVLYLIEKITQPSFSALMYSFICNYSLLCFSINISIFFCKSIKRVTSSNLFFLYFSSTIISCDIGIPLRKGSRDPLLINFSLNSLMLLFKYLIVIPLFILCWFLLFQFWV